MQLFDLAREKLNEELDMKNVLTFKRLGLLANRLTFKHYQRLFVNYSRRYTVSQAMIEGSELGRRMKGMDVKLMTEKCLPYENEVDERIFYELTGQKVNLDTFKDDSSDTDDGS